MATQRTKWDDFEPEMGLLGGIVERAVRDALQTSNPAIRMEAWQFLEICAPTVADRLRKPIPDMHQKHTGTTFNLQQERG